MTFNQSYNEDAFPVSDCIPQIKFHEQILNQVSDAVIATDNSNCVIYCNQSALIQYKLQADEVIGKPLRECYEYKWLKPEDEEIALTALQTQGFWRGENIHQLRDGEEIYVESRVATLKEESGISIGLVATIRDISDRKQAELAIREGEARFRYLADHAPVLIWMSGLDQLCFHFNKGWLDFRGRTMEQEVGKGWIDGVHPEDLRFCLDISNQAFANCCSFEKEYRLRRFDGEYRWILDIGIPRFDQKGEFLGYIGSCVDISDRKISEELLEFQNRCFASVAVSEPYTGTLDLLAELIELHIKDYLCSISVFDDENKLRCTAAPNLPFGFHPAMNDMSKSEIEEVLGANFINKIVKITDFVADLNADYGWTNCWSIPIYARNGQTVLGILSLYHHQPRQLLPQEIKAIQFAAHATGIAIERKNAELSLQKLNQELELKVEHRTLALRYSKESLQISERRFRSFFNFAPIGIAVADIDTYQFVAVNYAFCQILGYNETELLENASCPSVSVPNDWALELPQLESLLRGESNFYQLEKRYIRKNGEILIGNLITTVIKDDAGHITHLLGMLEDITNRKHAEERLRQSEELLRLTVENTPVGITTFALSGQFLKANHSICEILGYSEAEMLGKTIIDICHFNSVEETLNAIHSLMSGRALSCQVESQYIRKNRRTIDVVVHLGLAKDSFGNPLYFVNAIEDITLRKKNEASLKQQMERQRFLMDITQQIRQSLNVDEVLNTAVNEVQKLLNSDRVIIFRLFSNGRTCVVKESVAANYPSILNMNWSDEDFSQDPSFEHYIIPQPRIVNDVSQDIWANCLAEFMAQAGVKSKVVAPIVQHILPTKNQSQPQRWKRGNSLLWGLIIVHSCGEYRQWQQEEADLLQQVANQLAIAIQQADIYEQVRNELFARQQFEQELQKQANADRIFSEITTSINQSFYLNRTLDIALERARQFIGSDRVLIYQIHPEGNGVVIKEAVERSELSIVGRVINDSCFTVDEIKQKYIQGQITAIPDVYTLNKSCYTNLLQELQVTAYLAAPIIHSEQLWGLLLVHECDRSRAWQPSEINFVKQIAEQIGTAAQKERLYLQLTNELSQKEILLREIHHRVKNNLQIMSSLLRLQFRKTSPEVKAIAEEYQNRIQSMALIHDQLHRSDDLSRIDFQNYLNNLTANLFQCYGANPDLIKLNLLVRNVSLPLDQSIPLGLIINELLSNTLKYAFSEGQGVIDIQLTTVDDRLNLIVADNGVGLPPDFDHENTSGLGMQLVCSLTDQLGGQITYAGQKGTTFKLTFPLVS